MIKKKLCCLGFTLTESCTSTDFRMIMSLWSLFLFSKSVWKDRKKEEKGENLDMQHKEMF